MLCCSSWPSPTMTDQVSRPTHTFYEDELAFVIGWVLGYVGDDWPRIPDPVRHWIDKVAEPYNGWTPWRNDAGFVCSHGSSEFHTIGGHTWQANDLPMPCPEWES